MNSVSRRTALNLTLGTVAGLAGVLTTKHAQAAAEFTLQYANEHRPPIPTARIKEAADVIREETKGGVDIQVFPNNQLGGDTDMLSQLRSARMEFFTLSPLILSILVPNASISGVGFAGRDTTRCGRRWTASSAPSCAAQIRKSGLYAFQRCSTVASGKSVRRRSQSRRPTTKGIKIRVPRSPLWTSMFKAFEAAPMSINFSEVYSALQTKIAEGQENPLVIIDYRQALRGSEVPLEDQPHVGRPWLLANARTGTRCRPT